MPNRFSAIHQVIGAFGMSRLRELATHKISKIALLSVVNTVMQIVVFAVVFEQIGVEQFGGYRTFLSFASFSGLLHLGYADGLFLEWKVKRRPVVLSDLFRMLAITTVLLLCIYFTNWPLPNAQLLYAFVLLSNATVFFHYAFVVHEQYTSAVWASIILQLGVISYLLFQPNQPNLSSLLVCILVFNLLAFALLVFLAFQRKYVQLGHIDVNYTNGISVAKGIGVGLPVLVSGLFFLSIFNLDKIMLSSSAESIAFGLYALASSVVSVMVGVVAAPVNLILHNMVASNDVANAGVFKKSFNVLWWLGVLGTGCLLLLHQLCQWFTFKHTATVGFILLWAQVVFPLVVLQLLLANLYKLYYLSKAFLIYSIVAFLALSSCMLLIAHNHLDLHIAPALIAQLLLVLIVSMESHLLKRNLALGDEHNKRIVMIAFSSFVVWGVYGYVVAG